MADPTSPEPPDARTSAATADAPPPAAGYATASTDTTAAAAEPATRPADAAAGAGSPANADPVILTTLDAGLLTVTFNRPARKNALSAASWNELARILTDIELDPEIRAVVFTGAGSDFSSGADLTGGDKGLTGRGPQPVLHEMRIVGNLISRLRNVAKPTIAAVDGVAIGVALGIALACDLVVASDRARFTEVFVKRGLALDGGASWSLPHLVGMRRAKQMAFFGDTIDAATALQWGLINEVVPADDLAATAEAWGRRLATGPTLALGLIKKMLHDGAGTSFDEAVEGEARAQHIVYTTRDMREGMLAFMERRDPDFNGT